MKLSDQFRALDGYFERGHERTVEKCIRLADAYEGQFADEKKALTNRVAELETTQTSHLQEMERLAFLVVDAEQVAQIAKANLAALQSQLAWTPVEKGLPTEPGWYVFHGEDEGTELLFGADQGESSLWVGDSTTYEWPKRGYTHFRRIELPEAK